MPTPDGPDKDGVFSGCCVLDGQTPTLVYTGVWPEVQCLATTDDDGRTWSKHPANPVIAQRPEGLDLHGFRDPYVFRDGDGWAMVIGSGIKGEGGTILLYRSDDLVHWSFHGQAFRDASRPEHNWECPNLFPLEGRWVLIVSPHSRVIGWTGQWADDRFTADGPAGTLDLGERFYAPNTLADPQGRRILWGWLVDGVKWEWNTMVRTPEDCRAAGWCGCMTVPRVLGLDEHGMLTQIPAPELEALRGQHWQQGPTDLTPDRPIVLNAAGEALDILAEFDPPGEATVGLALRRSPDGRQETRLLYDGARGQLRIERGESPLANGGASPEVGGAFRLRPGEPLRLRVMLDRCVVETFANDRACLTELVFPDRPDALGVALLARNGPARLRRLDAWTMGSMWE